MPREVYPGAPRISSGTIAGFQKLPSRNSGSDPRGPFASLTQEQQRAAEQWLFKFCARWGSDLPPWRRAILTGVAKRLAKNPPGPKFGRQLFSIRCGKILAWPRAA